MTCGFTWRRRQRAMCCCHVLHTDQKGPLKPWSLLSAVLAVWVRKDVLSTGLMTLFSETESIIHPLLSHFDFTGFIITPSCFSLWDKSSDPFFFMSFWDFSSIYSSYILPFLINGNWEMAAGQMCLSTSLVTAMPIGRVHARAFEEMLFCL